MYPMMKIYALFSLLCFSVSGMADVPAEQKKEVEHLLAFVENSDCLMNRNGSKHRGEKAVKHIKKKYHYFVDDIKNTKDFIKYAASKSTMSGKYYQVNCPDKKPMATKDWLFDELLRYRASKINHSISVTGSKL